VCSVVAAVAQIASLMRVCVSVTVLVHAWEVTEAVCVCFLVCLFWS
jgi:hypothetical protein